MLKNAKKWHLGIGLPPKENASASAKTGRISSTISNYRGASPRKLVLSATLVSSTTS